MKMHAHMHARMQMPRPQHAIAHRHAPRTGRVFPALHEQVGRHLVEAGRSLPVLHLFGQVGGDFIVLGGVPLRADALLCHCSSLIGIQRFLQVPCLLRPQVTAQHGGEGGLSLPHARRRTGASPTPLQAACSGKACR